MSIEGMGLAIAISMFLAPLGGLLVSVEDKRTAIAIVVLMALLLAVGLVLPYVY